MFSQKNRHKSHQRNHTYGSKQSDHVNTQASNLQNSKIFYKIAKTQDILESYKVNSESLQRKNSQIKRKPKLESQNLHIVNGNISNIFNIHAHTNVYRSKKSSEKNSKQKQRGLSNGKDKPKASSREKRSSLQKIYNKTPMIGLKASYSQQRKKTHQNLLFNVGRQSREEVSTERKNELKWRERSMKKHKPFTIKGIYSDRTQVWNEEKVPYTTQQAVLLFGSLLTNHQKQEILQFKKIYYLGHHLSQSQKFHFFDKTASNEEKEYHWCPKDHIAYRYQIIESLGKGSYGQVIKVYDHQKKEPCALKIIKNLNKFNKQALTEFKILSYIKDKDTDNTSNIIKIRDFFIFRKYVCMTFELLSDNLYDLLGRNNYQGLPQHLVRRFTIQMLVSLDFLRRLKIIHCDLKPQNILLREYDKSGIKVIDFGSSCFFNETIYTYIQSRFYRAPQIFMGLPYDNRIDMWSCGCILGQLILGIPIFPGNNQFQQIKFFVNALGLPPKSMVQNGCRSKLFFTSQFVMSQKLRQTQLIKQFDLSLQQKFPSPVFRNFLSGFLKWDPKQRFTPAEALQHPWVQQGLPQQLKKPDNGDKNIFSQGSVLHVKKKSLSKQKSHLKQRRQQQ